MGNTKEGESELGMLMSPLIVWRGAELIDKEVQELQLAVGHDQPLVPYNTTARAGQPIVRSSYGSGSPALSALGGNEMTRFWRPFHQPERTC